jgi:pilus assembly protein CpaC
MIIVTPILAKAVNPSDLPRPTDNLVDANDPQGVFLGRVNKIYSSAEAAPLGPLKGRVGFIND